MKRFFKWLSLACIVAFLLIAPVYDKTGPPAKEMFVRISARINQCRDAELAKRDAEFCNQFGTAPQLK